MSLAENATPTISQDVPNAPKTGGHGPKFKLDIEGVIHHWSVSIITTEQIAELGCWDPAVGVIQIDADQNERQLEPGEVVHLKPGMGFSKKVRWKRGTAHG